MCLQKIPAKKQDINLQIADKDIVVYKVLRYYSTNTFMTPYMYHIVPFDNGIAVLTTEIIKGCLVEESCEWRLIYNKGSIKPAKIKKDLSFFNHKGLELYIFDGIHSYAKQKYCLEYDYFSFIAVIPKNSRYLIGHDGTMVSDNLIIFESFERYIQWKKMQ